MDRRNLASVFLLVLVTGCASADKEPAAAIVAASDMESVARRLADAAERAAAARERYSLVEIDRHPIADKAAPARLPAVLAERLEISFDGPVEALLRGMARRLDFQFSVIGPPPASDVLVRVDGKDRRIFDVLRDVGLQVRDRATVRLDAGQGLLELVYAQK